MLKRFGPDLAASLLVTLAATSALAGEPRHMEKLDRGVVAIVQPDKKIFVSWRLLGTEPMDTAFDLFRTTEGAPDVKLNVTPLVGPTHFIDDKADLSKATTYTVRVAGAPALGKPMTTAGDSFKLPAGATPLPYLSVPLQPTEGYKPNDASVADLDGDGQYEIILHQTGRAKDNSQSGVTDPPLLEAYKLDGTRLWQINLGKNIRDGAHYTQFMCYDLDGDGRAEIVCKTADGTTDGTGKVIGDANANYVNDRGYVLKGSEYLTVFDGQTGAAIDTVPYLPSRMPDDARNLDPSDKDLKDTWGDSYGNRMDRFLACVAYLDGVHPSVVFTRGYYGRSFLAAFDFKNGKLRPRWLFDSMKEGKDQNCNPYSSQGNHNLSVADVNGDGKDDIIFGGMTVGSDGHGLFSTGYGHGDAIHVGDLDPDNPGLEEFRIQERFDDAGAHMIDLKTGKTLWKKPSLAKQTGGKKVEGPGRGLAADIDPTHPGFECWAAGAGVEDLWDCHGNVIGHKKPTIVLGAGQGATFGDEAPTTAPATGDAGYPGREVGTCNFRVYWDGDTLDELLDKNTIAKWDWVDQKSVPLLTAKDCVSNNGTKSTPALSADILGDWREEVIWPTADGKELRIYTTTIPTDVRLYTLMHDPQYRLDIAWQNVGYNQPPHLGFSIEKGHTPPKPNIVTP